MEESIDSGAGPTQGAHALEDVFRAALRAERAAWDRLQLAAATQAEAERLQAWRDAVAWADAARDAYIATLPAPHTSGGFLAARRRATPAAARARYA